MASMLLAATMVDERPPAALAATAPSLGTASTFVALAGQFVSSSGATQLSGNVGVSPGSAFYGFPPAVIAAGTIHSADATAAQAQLDLVSAYHNLATQAVDTVLTGQDLGGLTLTPGVYGFAGSAQLSGTLTLDAQGNPDAVFVIQIATTLTTANGASVTLINQAAPDNVFWQVGSSASIGANSVFRGNILALTSITLGTGVTLVGRVLATNGSVNLDTNTLSLPFITTLAPLTASTVGQSVTFSASVSPAASGFVQFLDGGTQFGGGLLSGGVATFTTPVLSIGSHSITARYQSSPFSAPSTSNARIQIVAGVTTTTTLDPLTPAAVGQPTTFTAHVSPSLANGTVTFMDGSTSLGIRPLFGGVATLTAMLASGSHTITAIYSGDPRDLPSTSTSGSQVITAPPTMIVLVPSPTSVPSPLTTLTPSALPTVTAGTATAVASSTPVVVTPTVAAPAAADMPYVPPFHPAPPQALSPSGGADGQPQRLPLDSQALIDFGSFAAHPMQGPWSVLIDWGDATHRTLSLDHAGGIGGLPHAYHTAGTYTVTTTITDRLGLSAAASFVVHVTAATPTAAALAGIPPAVVSPASPPTTSDGESLASQSAETQALFRAMWGAQADAEWLAEHNAPGGH